MGRKSDAHVNHRDSTPLGIDVSPVPGNTQSTNDEKSTKHPAQSPNVERPPSNLRDNPVSRRDHPEQHRVIPHTQPESEDFRDLSLFEEIDDIPGERISTKVL